VITLFMLGYCASVLYTRPAASGPEQGSTSSHVENNLPDVPSVWPPPIGPSSVALSLPAQDDPGERRSCDVNI